MKQTTTNAKQFVDQQFKIADSLVAINGENILPDLNTLKTAAKFYANGTQMLKTQVMLKKLNGEGTIEFLENAK